MPGGNRATGSTTRARRDMSCLNTDCEKTYQECEALTTERDQLRAELVRVKVDQAGAKFWAGRCDQLRASLKQARDDLWWCSGYFGAPSEEREFCKSAIERIDSALALLEAKAGGR
jgi:hypothetical protein